MLHPHKDERGQTLILAQPSYATDLATWHQPDAVAVVVPAGPMPNELNSVAFNSHGFESHSEFWQQQADSMVLSEPPLVVVAGLKQSAGAIVRETDGRWWLVAPSNGFGGHQVTFPKGRLEGKSAKATALIEVYEESGLQIRLLSYLFDITRTTTVTRYYLAERIGGNPADMGWESQAVMLVPTAKLLNYLTHPSDLAIVQRLLACKNT